MKHDERLMVFRELLTDETKSEYPVCKVPQGACLVRGEDAAFPPQRTDAPIPPDVQSKRKRVFITNPRDGSRFGFTTLINARRWEKHELGTLVETHSGLQFTFHATPAQRVDVAEQVMIRKGKGITDLRDVMAGFSASPTDPWPVIPRHHGRDLQDFLVTEGRNKKH